MDFLGRKNELQTIQNWDHQKEPSRLTVIYGRRRIGKTRLVEEAYKNRKILKFEGLEGGTTKEQKANFLDQLSALTGKKEYKNMRITNWIDLLILLSNHVGKRPSVIFFDEFQWMASERQKLVSDFKYVWDNYFKTKNKVHFILCGSVSSFIVKKVLRSRALYGRIDQEIHLQPLSIFEIIKALSQKRSFLEVLETYLIFGGVPQYLEKINFNQSIQVNLQKLCFSQNAYFVHEFERIFVSHFGKNPHFKRILKTLSKRKFITRQELKESLSLNLGGRVSEYLEDLELADFIESYTPVTHPNSERLIRYRIIDPYILFYFKFIAPHVKKITQSNTKENETFILSHYLPHQSYSIWKGLAFEHFCRQHHNRIAALLGFSAVRYDSGAYFSRADQKHGFQIDLLFIRADHVICLCEIKFQDGKIQKSIISDVEAKISLLPNPKNYTIEKVLITASPPSEPLLQERYFHRILTCEELLRTE